MRKLITKRRSIVAACVAGATVALGGTATAAALITGAQIQDGSVHSRDVTNGSVTTTDVKDAALTPADYNGPVTGPAGPAGPTGPLGPPGVRNIEYRTKAGSALYPNQYGVLSVSCPPGTRALSGGISSTNPTAARISNSAPQDGGVGWGGWVHNEGSTNLNPYVWVVCAAG